MVCGAALILVAFARSKAVKYIVTDRRVSREYRFFSVRIDEIPLNRITSIAVEQNIVGRLLGFGDLRIGTADMAFPGVLFNGIRNPERAKSIISGLMGSMQRTGH